MKRFAIALFAVLIACAAPARAWCEASCLAPAHTESAKPHCPTHESSSGATQISAADSSDCPTIDAARPVPATLAIAQVAEVAIVHGTSARQPDPLRHQRVPSPGQRTPIPLRI